jgi:regulator of replication initiation timing
MEENAKVTVVKKHGPRLLRIMGAFDKSEIRPEARSMAKGMKNILDVYRDGYHVQHGPIGSRPSAG